MHELSLLLLPCALMVTACQQAPDASSHQSAPRVSAAAAAASAPAAPPAPTAPTVAGHWKGTYEASRHVIELSPKLGGVPEWAADDGKVATGKGSIELDIDDRGVVAARAAGPLGAQAGHGTLDGDVLTLRLEPTADNERGFGGTVEARRSADTLQGNARLSSADSLSVRHATLSLHKER